MKTKITVTDTNAPSLTLMGERNLFHSHAPQFVVRSAPELARRVQAKATGEKSRWYEVTHRGAKTVLTAE